MPGVAASAKAAVDIGEQVSLAEKDRGVLSECGSFACRGVFGVEFAITVEREAMFLVDDGDLDEGAWLGGYLRPVLLVPVSAGEAVAVGHPDARCRFAEDDTVETMRGGFVDGEYAPTGLREVVRKGPDDDVLVHHGGDLLPGGAKSWKRWRW